MNTMRRNQKGGAFVTIIVLVVLAYGIFVGIQYVPLKLESQSVDSVLESLESSQKVEPATSVQAVEKKIKGLLFVDQRGDLIDVFDVKRKGYGLVVEAKYERELNLIYTVKTLQYEKSLTLN